MFQYPKNEHITLPSVEGAFGTTNILRDPPKSIMTRYKPRVGDTNQITEQIAGAGDRICEVIKPFARGINPMVSVSYSNHGTNGGQVKFRSGGEGVQQSAISSSAAKLPYRVNREDAFRPPIIPPQDLLPLSRLPRLPTKAQTNVGSGVIRKDVANNLSCSTDLKQIRQNLLKTCGSSNRMFNIQRPHQETSEVQYMVNQNKLHYNATTNTKDVRYQPLQNYIPERGVKDDTLYSSVSAGVSRDINTTPLDQLHDGRRMGIQNALHQSYNTNVSGIEKNNYIHTIQERGRNLPKASMTINGGRNIDLNSTISSRDYYLPPKASLGGFKNAGTFQSSDRAAPKVELYGNQVKMDAAAQFEQRFSQPYR